MRVLGGFLQGLEGVFLGPEIPVVQFKVKKLAFHWRRVELQRELIAQFGLAMPKTIR